jgi:UDP-N-acetylglucosamine diphosphorylase/glucosamine-1-phosphate N-acetyltransferase
VDLGYFLNKKENKDLNRIKERETFIEYKKIFAGKNVKILPGVVLDASEGRIVIEENTVIEPFTYIKGPVYIGKNSLIKSGTKIYGPCVIGEFSKVAGEIAESVFHSYVNKQHDGFVGHSYICPFVNLGADTVTSDLKNNYSKVGIKLSGENIDTGMQLLGSIIGDHSKTSINTMLNTGSMIGIFANIFGGGFPSKEIASFSWNEAGKQSEKYDIDKAIETARIVMSRRGLKMSEAYENLVRGYFI